MKNFIRLSTLILVSLLLICCQSNKSNIDFFRSAKPVWPEGRQFEKNLSIAFISEFKTNKEKNTVLKICGSSLYRIYLNDQFVGHGPARAGHGYYRVDEWDLGTHLNDSANILRIEAASYNVNSYYLLDQPGFLQAEVISGKKIIAATSDQNDDFMAFEMKERVQKVPRYSFQRPFIEYYRISDNPSPLARGDTGGYYKGLEAYGLRLEDKDKEEGLRLEEVEMKELIPRRIPYPDFDIVRPDSIVAAGKVKTGIKREWYWRDRAVVNIGPKLGGFPEDELEYNPAIELQEMEYYESLQSTVGSLQSVTGDGCEGEYMIYDFGTNLTGFIGAEIEVQDTTRLFFTFDEILQDGDVNFRRLGTIAAVTYDFLNGNVDQSEGHPGLDPGPPGTGNNYQLESFEPYTFRYLKIIVPKGSVTIKDIYLREYANPDIKRASFECSDERLNRIFDAGVETFRQNAVDVFMDCPHRERAGWLCDSYFTSRVAMDLSGNNIIEKNFYENFLLPDSFPHLPEGMLPMCYPADHNDSVFIPNWAMWFVVQLEEYLERSGDNQLVDALEPRVMALLDYFEPFKNDDGLLENLESWIFIEWSAANRFVQDVNYPTNMLFAKTLYAAGTLYNNQELIKEAEKIREVIRGQAFNGQFFIDNAIRQSEGHPELVSGPNEAPPSDEKGILVATHNTTEVCQYFAFFFDIASPETHPELWKKLSTEFGPDRTEKGLYPDVHPANSFVGNYIRLELLSRYGLKKQILEESIDFFDYMALRTGTLWENTGTYASCNHGFASHVVHVLYRDILGIEEVDYENRVVSCRLSDVGLDFCEGQVPIGDDLFKFEWKKSGDEFEYHYGAPEGYEIVVNY